MPKKTAAAALPQGEETKKKKPLALRNEVFIRKKERLRKKCIQH